MFGRIWYGFGTVGQWAASKTLAGYGPAVLCHFLFGTKLSMLTGSRA